ncbi:acetyltransferase, GNAT family, partial [Ostertagia ostertagi]
MKQMEFEIIEKIPPDDIIWKDWKDTIRAEGWIIGADDSVLSILPELAKVVMARDKADGGYIGSVVWCENNGLAYIAFYIIRPEYRGLGIGSIIWKRAMERIPSNYTVGLRSVEYMVPRYKSMNFPVEGQHTFYQKIRANDFLQIAKSHITP